MIGLRTSSSLINFLKYVFLQNVQQNFLANLEYRTRQKRTCHGNLQSFLAIFPVHLPSAIWFTTDELFLENIYNKSTLLSLVYYNQKKFLSSLFLSSAELLTKLFLYFDMFLQIFDSWIFYCSNVYALTFAVRRVWSISIECFIEIHEHFTSFLS